jgi:hypothetical protein
MDNIKKYIPIFLSTFVSLAALMTLLAMIEPHAFSLVPGVIPDSSLHASADSLANPDLTLDSSQTVEENHGAGDHAPVSAAANHDPGGNPVDEKPKGEKHDTAKVSVVTSVDNGFKLPTGPAVGPDTLTETERKKMVQIFEAMEAESAARILLNMSDAAVKQVLTTMKKRQSAKILAALQPEQAARILKEKL